MVLSTSTCTSNTTLELPFLESGLSPEKAADSVCNGHTEALVPPQEVHNLPHVRDRISLAVWLAVILAGFERFAYFGLTTPLQNFIQNSPANQLRPGGLGLGQNVASVMMLIFTSFASLTTIFGAIIADRWLGRFNVLVISFSIYGVGALILSATASPGLLQQGAGLGGLITAMVLITIGVGGTRANMVAFTSDQYIKRGNWIQARQNKKSVIVEESLTMEAIFNVYYWAINIGSLSGIATTFMEKHIGFWAAFLLPTCALAFALLILLFGRSRFVRLRANGSVLPHAAKAVWFAIKGGFTWNAARPAFQSENFSYAVPWSDTFIDELKQASNASRLFLSWPMLWVCRIQFNTNLVSQAAQMRTYGIPNDLMFYTNAVAVLVFLPLFDRVIYPSLRQYGYSLLPLSRITIGFLFEACAMAYAAGLQSLIYGSGPCFKFPLECPASDGGLIPNDVNVWAQTPIYVLEALSEVLVSPAGYEFADRNAPTNMKGSMQAIFSSSMVGGAVLGLAISPTYKDPYLVIVYSALASGMAVATGLFYLQW